MNKGFTLVELIAVIVILGLLVIITTPAYDSVSKNIKERNYESKKSAIKAQTLSFVDKYMKDKVYSGNENDEERKKGICLTVNFLIRNGIIASDSDEEEYIYNEDKNSKDEAKDVYLQIFYDYKNLKTIALAYTESLTIDDSITFSYNDGECKEIY